MEHIIPPKWILIAILGGLALVPGAAKAAEGDGDSPGDNYYGRRHDRSCADGNADDGYRLRVAQWRSPDEDLSTPAWAGAFRELRLRSAHGGGRLALVPFDEQGAVTDEARREITALFKGGRENDDIGVDERLVRILYLVALHFQADEIVVVSGYRDPSEDNRTSNHHLGKAVDIIVPGVPNEEVAAYAREFGRLGVGYYPVSGFVHVDVRDRSFFWRDPSGPGEPICTQGILPEVAREVDDAYDPSFESPLRYAPVAMPAEPDNPGLGRERRADRLDEIDDEASMAAIFQPAIRDELRTAERAAERAAARRAEREQRRREAAEREAAASRAEETTEGSLPSGGGAAGGDAAPDQPASNTTSPPTTVATALPGNS